jgi:predicted ribosomally synthesized peptide with SipW-like signal peptide
MFRRQSGMNKKLVISLVLIGALAFSLGLGSYAWFSSEAVSENNVFASGTLSLNVNDDVDGVYTLELGEINNIAPGDIMPEEEIIIKNDGTLNLAWAGRFELDGDTYLAKAIYIKEMKMEFLDDNGEDWEPEDHFISNGVGAGVYASYYDGLKDEELGVITLEKFLADGGMSPANPGIQMGALKPGYSYKLTFTLGMAEKTGNEFQGLNMDLSYKVDATQINAGALAEVRNGLDGHITWFEEQIAKQN